MRMHVLPCLLSLLVCASVPAQEGENSNRPATPMPRVDPRTGSGSFSSIRSRGGSELERSMRRHELREQAWIEERRRLNRPESAPRITRIDHYPGTRIVIPCGWDRAILRPDEAFWGRRDLMADIQVMARSGFIPATPVAPDATEVKGVADFPAGWKAYALAVPPKGSVTLRLSHAKPAWFRMILSNKWGSREEGMLRPAGAPLLGMLDRTYTNPSGSPKAIYFIVDDPGWWSSQAEPYTVAIERSWDPATVDLSSVKFAAGLWGAQPSVSAEYRHPTLQAVGH